MPRKAVRAVVDTNLWISFLITKDFTFFDNLLVTGKVKLLFSEEFFEEFLHVVKRPKMRKYFSLDKFEDLISLFKLYGEIVDVESRLTLCRDPKDDFLLSLSVDGKADYLVTGDSDLLDLGTVGKTRIITVKALLALFRRHA